MGISVAATVEGIGLDFCPSGQAKIVWGVVAVMLPQAVNASLVLRLNGPSKRSVKARTKQPSHE